jgi:3-phenylpropionate/trans-cinnamate dioxygenase ferredoxin reductase subunit
MAQTDWIVVLGAGHAGGRAAQSLRDAGFDGNIVLVGTETVPPYERPPLSKEVLVGAMEPARTRLHSDAFYGEQRIELRLGSEALAIDRDLRRVRLGDGGSLDYDRLVLTPGARVRRLEVPGAALPGIHYLRDLADSAAIKAGLGPGRHFVVIGGGFIGLETASSAVTLGATVTVVEAFDRLMARALAPELSDWFLRLHKSRGVAVHLSAQVRRFEGEGKVERVVLADGTVLAADCVVIGIGIHPNVEFAAQAGLSVENGIVVDEFCRTSDERIFAAGDAVSQPSPFLGRQVRLESYGNAQDQGMAVGRNAAGAATPFADRLWVWSDQHGVNLQMLGQPREWDGLVFRGDPAGERFTAFYLQAGRIVAVNTVNNGRDIRPVEQLMRAGTAVDPARLADPAVRYRDLTAG